MSGVRATRASDRGRAVHEVMLFGSDEEFLASTVPFVRDGLEREESVLAVAAPPNMAALRASLGERSPEVRFADASEWNAKPAETMGAYHAFIAAEIADGRPGVRIIGEVAWPEGDRRLIAEWTRYESILNEVFAALPAWVICPYDTRRLSPEIVDGSRATHPFVIEAGVRAASDEYLNPEQLLGASASRLEVPTAGATRMFDPMQLGSAGTHVAREAQRARLDSVTVEKIAAAASEVLLNAFIEARGVVSITTWTEDGEFVCQIEDDGPGLADRFAGYRPPDDPSSGWGLWLARLLSDLLEIGAGAGGTAVRMRFRDAA